MPSRIDVQKGTKYFRLTYIEDTEQIKRKRCAKFICDCGKNVVLPLHQVRSGKTKSCGCYHTEVIRMPKKHGECSLLNGYTREYIAWKAMKDRCSPRKEKAPRNYKNYYERGIDVCDEWKHSFNNFINDMGRKPSNKHSLDRIDNDKGYSKGNCRWATLSEQRRNNRQILTYVEYEGKRLIIADWAKISGISEENISSRLRKGWSIKDAIFKPTRKRI